MRPYRQAFSESVESVESGVSESAGAGGRVDARRERRRQRDAASNPARLDQHQVGAMSALRGSVQGDLGRIRPSAVAALPGPQGVTHTGDSLSRRKPRRKHGSCGIAAVEPSEESEESTISRRFGPGFEPGGPEETPRGIWYGVGVLARSPRQNRSDAPRTNNTENATRPGRWRARKNSTGAKDGL